LPAAARQGGWPRWPSPSSSAIWFENWGRLGDWYLHPFGRHGQSVWVAEFYNFWLHAREQGLKVPLGEYCYEWLAAVKNRFALRENPRVN
jgi:tryptophan halogenase